MQKAQHPALPPGEPLALATRGRLASVTHALRPGRAAVCLAALGALLSCSPAPASPASPDTSTAPASAAPPPSPPPVAAAPSSSALPSSLTPLVPPDQGPARVDPATPPPLQGPGETGAEQRIFRQVMMGRLPRASRRTWTLSRSKAAVRLRALCQTPTPEGGLNYRSITGRENDDSLWVTSGWVDYAGEPSTASPAVERLTRSAGDDKGPCPGPARIELRCGPSTASALRPGAALTPGRKGNDDRVSPARWQPPGRSSTPVLRCLVTVSDDPETWGGWLHDHVDPFPLMFVAPTAKNPGIEWVFENSDMVVQEGAYRWLPGGG